MPIVALEALLGKSARIALKLLNASKCSSQRLVAPFLSICAISEYISKLNFCNYGMLSIVDFLAQTSTLSK